VRAGAPAVKRKGERKRWSNTVRRDGQRRGRTDECREEGEEAEEEAEEPHKDVALHVRQDHARDSPDRGGGHEREPEALFQHR